MTAFIGILVGLLIVGLISWDKWFPRVAKLFKKKSTEELYDLLSIPACNITTEELNDKLGEVYTESEIERMVYGQNEFIKLLSNDRIDREEDINALPDSEVKAFVSKIRKMRTDKRLADKNNKCYNNR